MRLRTWGLLAGIGFSLAGWAAAQAPAVSGQSSVTRRETHTVEPSPNVVSPEAAPKPVGFESDIYCFGYISDANEAFPVHVHGAENLASQTDYITGDLLYVDGGYDKGLKIGDPYWLITPEQEVFDPMTRKSIGRLYQYRGRAMVQSIEPHTAIVQVINACTDIPLGAGLKKFEPIPIPLARKTPPAQPGDPPTGKPTGNIVFTRDGIVAVGQDATVIINLGAANGVQPGDFLTVFRYTVGTDYGIGPIGTYWVNLPPPPGVVVPRTYLGEVAILVAGDRWAIGRVTDSSHLIEVGDEVEVK
jgi:hypothetical protein